MNIKELQAIKNSGIEFKIDKNGKKLAYYYNYKSMRKIKIKLGIGENLIATGQVKETKLL